VSIKTKTDIRKEVLKTLRNQKEEERFRKSLVILDKLFATPEFQSSKTVLFYSSFDVEVKTFEMMLKARESGKQVALPTINVEKKEIIPSIVEDLHGDLETGPYGIQHVKEHVRYPVDPRRVELVIVPGIAFDRGGYRIGRGAGFYDRFLARFGSEISSIGLAFDFQVFEQIPHDDHDIPVTQVITN